MVVKLVCKMDMSLVELKGNQKVGWMVDEMGSMRGLQ